MQNLKLKTSILGKLRVKIKLLSTNNFFLLEILSCSSKIATSCTAYFLTHHVAKRQLSVNYILMGCLYDPANVQQTSSKCIQNTRANAGRLLDRVNTL